MSIYVWSTEPTGIYLWTGTPWGSYSYDFTNSSLSNILNTRTIYTGSSSNITYDSTYWLWRDYGKSDVTIYIPIDLSSLSSYLKMTIHGHSRATSWSNSSCWVSLYENQTNGWFYSETNGYDCRLGWPWANVWVHASTTLNVDETITSIYNRTWYTWMSDNTATSDFRWTTANINMRDDAIMVASTSYSYLTVTPWTRWIKSIELERL